jgi:hypothetical protein
MKKRGKGRGVGEDMEVKNKHAEGIHTPWAKG